MSNLDAICYKFDRESFVPYGTSAHSTKPDITDMKTVVSILLKRNILTPTGKRSHEIFPRIHFDPLHNWDVGRTLKWIEEKKKAYLRCDTRGWGPLEEGELDETEEDYS